MHGVKVMKKIKKGQISTIHYCVLSVISCVRCYKKLYDSEIPKYIFLQSRTVHLDIIKVFTLTDAKVL
jgi:hypothetical protein